MIDNDFDPLFFSFQQALAGRYSIDRELGRGGMGVVYLAREVHLDRLVAIKLLPPERAAESGLRERFLGEARLAAKLSHPNIIPIHSVEDRDGFVFYVMAFIDGESLAQRVRDRGPLSTSEGTRILREVAWALGYAHAQGLVHRDVKPDNILIESSTGRVLVADFGIAAAAGVAAGDGVSGTPEFMSPEQVLGGLIDARSDLYGWGATAFYTFSGRHPFEGTSTTQVLAKQVTELAPPIASLGLTVPRKLGFLIDRCLAKEPDQRPASAQALAEQLGLALEQRREIPLALRAFVKRRGRILAGGVVISVAGFVIAWQLFVGITRPRGGGPLYTLLFVVMYFTYHLVASSYRLMLQGYTHEDLGPAFKAEIDEAKAELGVERTGRKSVVATRALGYIAKASGIVAAVSVLWLSIRVPPDYRHSPDGNRDLAGMVLAISMVVGVLATFGWQTLLKQTRDIDTEYWGKVWTGRIGKAAFALATKLVGNRKRATAMTHRATELSLGMAAEHLFESLPKESQRALGDLPKLLRRLQADAQSLRKRYDELQEVLGNIDDAAAAAEFADLRLLRDTVHAKLGEAVGAMETIRLNLLRLHAGSATVAGVTTHLNLARDVSDEVERLVAAHEEVDRMLDQRLKPLLG